MFGSWSIHGKAVEKYEEMKLRQDYAYIMFRFVSNKIEIRKEVKKNEIKDKHDMLIVDKMDLIIALWFRECIHKQQFNTNIFALIIKSYFEIANGDYVAAFVKEVVDTMNKQCCYAVLDWNNKLAFVCWYPENAKSIDKMRHACYGQVFKSNLEGISCTIQANDSTELTVEIIEERLKFEV